MPQKRLCFGLAGCVWVVSFEPYVLSHRGACFAYISRLYMAVACGERSENVPPKWLFSWVTCHI